MFKFALSVLSSETLHRHIHSLPQILLSLSAPVLCSTRSLNRDFCVSAGLHCPAPGRPYDLLLLPVYSSSSSYVSSLCLMRVCSLRARVSLAPCTLTAPVFRPRMAGVVLGSLREREAVVYDFNTTNSQGSSKSRDFKYNSSKELW